jgi:hypothetical protein
VGKEAEERHINLPEDDPEMIRRLIGYLYVGDYDPSDELGIPKFYDIFQHESTTSPAATHHSRYQKIEPSVFWCACLSPNHENLQQPLKADNPGHSSSNHVMAKTANVFQVVNPFTIHATMYTLGDQYQVNGLCGLAKAKFEWCLHHHLHSDDFISAVQLASSTTPESNRGLRDAVVMAFQNHFKVDIT